MNATTREQRLSAAFVAVADTLVTGFDLIDQMRTLVDACVDVLDVEAAGILLLDSGDTLRFLVATSEQADFVQVLQLDAGAGPCVECFATGTVVAVDDIATAADLWPEFSAAAAHRGFHSVYAVPMRLRGQVIGTLNLFSTKPGALNAPDAAVAQALADVATIGIIQERSIRETGLVSEQLQHALRSRVVIEQAKGVLSATAGMDVDEAFEILRRHARQQNLSLQQVAADVAARILYLSRDGGVVRA